jgi:hypothetical protein
MLLQELRNRASDDSIFVLQRQQCLYESVFCLAQYASTLHVPADARNTDAGTTDDTSTASYYGSNCTGCTAQGATTTPF